MQPSNNFRLVLRKDMLIGETEHGDRVFGTVKVLQQWWKGYGSFLRDEQSKIESYLCKDGEWRDVEVVEE